MTVEELIKEVEKQKKLKKEYDFSKHLARKYMPYAEKEALVKAVVNSTSYADINGKKVYLRDTTGMVFVFTLKLIEGYTDIEINKAASVQEYDMLMESGVMNTLTKLVPKEETNILQGMLDMKREDLEFNTRSLVAFLETKFEVLQMALDNFGNVLDNPKVQAKIEELTKADKN